MIGNFFKRKTETKTAAEIKISANPMSDGQVIRFEFDQDIFKVNSLTLSADPGLEKCPFASDLFKQIPIKRFHVDGKLLWLELEDLEVKNWQSWAKKFGSQVRMWQSTGQVFFSENMRNISSPSQTDQPQNNSELVTQIKEVLDREISPGLAGHGGSVSVERYESGILYLKFQGGCQGCAQIDVTLKQGIEQHLKKKFPELREIVDVTDHNSGSNPYFN